MDIIRLTTSHAITMRARIGGVMEKKHTRLKRSICMLVITLWVASVSFCFADNQPSIDSEMTAVFLQSLDTECGNGIRVLVEANDLEMDRNHAVTTRVLGGEVILVPLISTDLDPTAAVNPSHQASSFLAYIDLGASGRFLVFLEVMKDQADDITAFKIVFPSGKGLMLSLNPFCLFQMDGSQTGFSLQDNDDLDNSMIISDTCETLRIIIIVFTAGCLISLNPIPCTIATVMETIYQILC